MDITEDRLLNKRVVIYQPAEGYRVAIDPVLLAASVPVEAGQHVLDLGVGTGAISLCLQARVNKILITGIDTNTTYLELAQKSVARNQWTQYIDLHFGDVRKPPRLLKPASYDFVVANPPFFEADSYSPSPDLGKSRANATDGQLADWVACAHRYLKPEGGFFLIFPADARQNLISQLKSHFNAVQLCQILPRMGQKPKRVIIWAKNAGVEAETEVEPLVLHDEAGQYTPQARKILWDMGKLGF